MSQLWATLIGWGGLNGLLAWAAFWRPVPDDAGEEVVTD